MKSFPLQQQLTITATSTFKRYYLNTTARRCTHREHAGTRQGIGLDVLHNRVRLVSGFPMPLKALRSKQNMEIIQYSPNLICRSLWETTLFYLVPPLFGLAILCFTCKLARKFGKNNYLILKHLCQASFPGPDLYQLIEPFSAASVGSKK